MRNWTGFIVVWGLLMLMLAAGTPATLAEDPASPPADDDATADDSAPAPEPVDEKEKKRIPFGLYLSVAAGAGDSDELTSSIAVDELDYVQSFLNLSDQSYGRAAIGWHLPHGKGDFRLTYQGVKEEEYEFTSTAFLNQAFDVSGAAPSIIDVDPSQPWWFLNIRGGQLTAVRAPPECVPNMIDPSVLDCVNETPTSMVSGTMPDNLQNRISTYDLTYGREFGGRRYSSHWWGGLRYFQYEGQVLAGAWLNLSTPGVGYTDGSFLRLLYIAQETSGFGPVGSWEVDFNFFDKGLQFYILGEAAFTLNSMQMDSGAFFQVLDPATGDTLADRMAKDLDKSSWQNKAEVGARVNLKLGLQLELAYSIAGYLDFILMPDLLQLGVTNERPQTFTQDIIFHTAHFGVGFQF
jgi:hypothetical protein